MMWYNVQCDSAVLHKSEETAAESKGCDYGRRNELAI